MGKAWKKDGRNKSYISVVLTNINGYNSSQNCT